MAAIESKYPLGSPQESMKMCTTHNLPIDVICEHCDEFICGKCAKTDHRDHEWTTLPTAASQRKNSLFKFLTKIKVENLPGMSGIHEKIEEISKQISENKERYNCEINKLQKHFDEIITRLSEIRKNNEERLKENLNEKNEKLNDMKAELNKKRKEIAETVQFIKDNNSTMSDYSLIDNHKKLKQLLAGLHFDINNCEHSLKYIKGEIIDEVLENMIGQTLDLNNISLSGTSLFKYGDKIIDLLRSFCEGQCYIRQLGSDCIEQVDNEGEKQNTYSFSPSDMCMADTGEIYCTDSTNHSISCLSPSGSLSMIISTDPQVPIGICQSIHGGVLVTFVDHEILSQSKGVVRHLTVTGEIIQKYEFQEDGQTRLFTLPDKITQNSNSDICVVNYTSGTTGDLVIISPSGNMKFIYNGHSLMKSFIPRDVVCDPLYNILVTDISNNQIHLLSPDGEFLKFLLTENEVNNPYTLSLYKSTLWVGYSTGLVKVFQYKM
ncbi:uncharacterized protein LOC134245467 [Saccostrea cucullata]|uniref:uncharacterized protein LOC134245467 n=1 Tax=Saccostrea cuccullata TaxID=36930 RepID=UPI002ED55D18